MNTKAISLIYIIFFLSLSTFVSAKDFYWIGGSGNWNEIQHWSDQPGGKVNPDAQVPNYTDNVFFDENSFPDAGAEVVINDVALCANMDWSQVTNFPTLISDNNPAHYLAIYGGLKLSTDMHLNIIKPLYFRATSLNNEIDFAGHAYNGDIHFTKNGGWEITTLLNVQNHIIYFEQGNLNFAADVSCAQIIAENPVSRTWNLNNSIITLTESGASVLKIDTDNLILNSGNSKFIASGSGASIELSGTSSIRFSDVDFQKDGSGIINDVLLAEFNHLSFMEGGNLKGTNRFQTLSFTPGKTYIISGGANQTVLGEWSAYGNCSEYINISGTDGVGKIVANSTNLSNLKIKDIEASGAAAPFNAPNSFNLGGAINWNISAPVSMNYTWKGGTDNNWSTPANWSNNCIPSRIDNASIIGNFDVEIDIESECKNLTLSDDAGLLGSGKLSIYGSLDAGNAGWEVLGSCHFEGNANHTIRINNSFKSDVYFSGGGTWQLDSELKIPNNRLYFESGTINSNNHNLNLNQFISTGIISRTLELGTSTLSLSGNTHKTWDVEGSNFLIDGAYEIELTTLTAGFYNNHSTSLSYKKVSFTDNRDQAHLTNDSDEQVNFIELFFAAGASISGNHNYDKFTLSAGKTYLFKEGSKQRITQKDGFIAKGTCSEFIYLEGNGGISTIISDVNSDLIDYVQITDLDVNGAVLKSGGLRARNSFGISNYDGWNITTDSAGSDYTWEGTVDSDWFNPGNWDKGCVPTRLDNVFFDEKNIVGGSKLISINGTRAAECNDMIWSNATSLSFEGNTDLNIYGQLDFSTLTTFDYNGIIHFKSEIPVNVKLDKVILASDVLFEGNKQKDGTWISGKWNLTSDFETSGIIKLKRGDLITDGFNLTCDELYSNFEDERKLQLDNSTLHIKSIFLTPNNELNFDAGTSEIILAKDGKVVVTTGNTAIDFYNVTFDQPNGAAQFEIRGSNVSFNQIDVKSNANFLFSGFDVESLILNKGKTYKFYDGKVYNIGKLIANGSCEGTIDISSLSAGEHTTFNSKNGDPISISQVNLIDIHATPDATFTASNSIDLGNTDGWIFTDSPVGRNLYWIGGTGYWDDPAHWAETLGGSGGACVPTALDNVHFDVNSFSGKNQIVYTGSGDIRCKTMDWRGSENTSPTFQTGDVDISSVYIYGSLHLNENLTIDLPDLVNFYFRSTDKGNSLLLHDFVFPNDVVFDGIGGEWTLENNLNIEGNFILNNGSFISNDLDISCNYFESSDMTPTGKKRSLDIQNSTLTINGYEKDLSVNIDATDLNVRQTLTLLANGSQIIVKSEKAFYIWGASTSATTFNSIRFDNEGSLISYMNATRINELTFEQGGEIVGNLNMGKLVLNKGTGSTFKFESNHTFPIEEFTALGSCNYPIRIQASENGKQANLAISTSLDANFIELTDINGDADTGLTYTANNSLIISNVTNWTVQDIAAVDLYWVGNGLTDDWSDYLNWSKTSGGTFKGCIPTPIDNVFFDSNSFLGSKTVLVDTDATCHDISWSDDIDPATVFKLSHELQVHGFLNFSENMSIEMSSTIKFKGDGLSEDKLIDFAGKSLDGDIYFDGKDQSWVLDSELSTTGDLFLDDGALNTKGYNLSIGSFSSLADGTTGSRKLDISGSIITINSDKLTAWNMIFLGTPLEFTAINSELYFPNGGGIYCESSKDIKFGDAIFDENGQININGNNYEDGKGEFKTVLFHQQGQVFGNNTFSNLEFTLGYEKNTIQSGRTINIINDLMMEGVHCSATYLKASNSGEPAFIISAKSQQIYYASLEDIEIDNTSGPHKVKGRYWDMGGNKGWIEDSEISDDEKDRLSYQETLDKREEWCSKTAILDHVTYFPINNKTTFQWSISRDNGTTYEPIQGKTYAIIEVTESGLYQVELNYNPPSGEICKLYSTIEIVMNEVSTIVIDFKADNVSCYSKDDGYITAEARDGHSPYTFYWTNEADEKVDASSPINTNKSIASHLAPGKYSIQVIDDKKCDLKIDVDIFNAYEIFINDITKKDLMCFNIADGEISIDASGGTGNLSYYLDGSLESTNITKLSADEYLVHVQDDNDCKTDEETVELLSPDKIIFDFTPSGLRCFNDKDGTINPQVSGGIAPYVYFWTASNGFTSNDAIISDLSGASYSLKITDAYNCIYNEPFELIEPEAISFNEISVKPANCFGKKTGEIFVEAEKGTSPYEYSLDGTTNKDGKFTGLLANTYLLQVTDKNSCIKLENITVNEPIEMGFVIADTLAPTCNYFKDGIINIEAYGGNGDYNFAWSGPDDFRSYTKNNTGLDFGDYTLLLKDKKGCSLEKLISLNKSNPLQLGLVVEQEVSNRGAKDGSFRLEIIGGATFYEYSVIGPNSFTAFNPTSFDENTALFENLAGGLYTVTINDANSCGSITKNIMLPEGDLLISQIINQKDVSCQTYNDGALNARAIGGNGTYTYSWSGPSGFSANTKSISGLNPGTYILTVQSDGQIATDETMILEPATLEASYSLNDVACFNEPSGSIELTISGGTKPYSILWKGDGGLLSHADKIYDLAKGDYHYKITDARECIVSNTVTINQPTLVTVSAVPTDITKIGERDGTITATAVGGTQPYTFFVSGPNEYTKRRNDDYTGTFTVDILEQGIYIIEILDANGCRAITETRIYEPEKMIVSLVSKTTPICHGGTEGSIEVLIEDGSSDFTLSWEANNHYKNEDAPLKIDNLKAGYYTLTVTDNVTTEVIKFYQEVKEPDPVSVEYRIDQIICSNKTGGYINIYPKGGTPNYTYKWTGVVSDPENEDQTNLSPGSYSVKVTDVNSCESETIPFEIKTPDEFSVTPTPISPLCYGDTNGEIKLDITNGKAPYTVIWSTGSVTQNITNLKLGTYTYTVIDDENCLFSKNANLTQPDSLIFNIDISQEIQCFGDDSGIITADGQGGTQPYNFNWSNGETTEEISNLGPGKYELLVTDEHACQDTASIIIEEPEKLKLRIEANRPTVEGANDGEIYSRPIGGIADYTALWEIQSSSDSWETLSSTDLDVTNLDRGKYKLTINDVNLCQVDTLINLEYLYDRVIEIPRAFTPNNDSYNDYWDIHRIEFIQRLTIVIYDRLGTSVYVFTGTGNEYKGNPWTGTSNNSSLPIGTYYYAIEVDGSKPLIGTVTIVR